MDFNHDYSGTNEFLVTGNQERLQAIKTVVYAYGDLGYTDPPIPSIEGVVGEYTDADAMRALETDLRRVLLLSQVVRDTDIVSIQVVSSVGDNKFKVAMQFVFGSMTIDV